MKNNNITALREKCINNAKQGKILITKKRDGFLDKLTFAELISLATTKYALTENDIADLKAEDLKRLILSVHNFFL